MSNDKGWSPIGIASLEPNADRAVRALGTNLILAGPGAGKTEFLAQKALYLFQTDSCAKPKRILAISFKKDSAKNLEDRVEARLAEVSGRFDSMTFDAFSKSILDRFVASLPVDLKIKSDYELSLKEIDTNFILDFCREIQIPKGINDYQIRNLRRDNIKFFLKDYFYSFSLLKRNEKTFDGLEWLSYELWKELLHHRGKAILTFPMITRLAEIIVHHNPLLKKAILMTYSDVFLDEFQDTTIVQFDFLKTIFKNARTRLTAVGDNKQRIMGYAMALENSFDSFQKEFGGEIVPLYKNFRSAKNLVAVQHFFAQAIDDKSVLQQSYSEEDRGECNVVVFKDDNQEADMLSVAIGRYVEKEKIEPSDIVILTKMQPQKYAGKVISKLNALGISARVEEQYQDLLKDEVISFLLDFISISLKSKNDDSYLRAVDFVKDFRDISGDLEVQKMEHEISVEINKIKKISCKSYSKEILLEIVQTIIDFLGIELIKGAYPQYKQGNYLNSVLERFINLLNDNINAREGAIYEGVEDFKGVRTVKIMSIHKSKGLEFHTVIFVGLEDSAFWSFSNQKTDDLSAFFVALSRARERMLFTFCEKRDTRGFLEQQSNKKINELFELLKKAGVPLVDVRSK